jgi:hypothetical protein
MLLLNIPNCMLQINILTILNLYSSIFTSTHMGMQVEHGEPIFQTRCTFLELYYLYYISIFILYYSYTVGSYDSIINFSLTCGLGCWVSSQMSNVQIVFQANLNLLHNILLLLLLLSLLGMTANMDKMQNSSHV